MAKASATASSPDPYAGWLHLRSVNAVVPPAVALDQPLIMTLALEDACWEFGRLALAARRPHWWRLRERQTWRGEWRRLEEKRRRLLESMPTKAPLSHLS